MINGHGGNIYSLAKKAGCAPSEIIDMSSNVNPIGPPPGLLRYLKENIESVTALPEADARSIIAAFSSRHHIPRGRVLAANGTTQFIYTIPKALGSENVLIVGPTYADYEDACIMHNVHYNYLISKESSDFRPDLCAIEKSIKGCDTVFICNPNNPTGALILADELESIVSKYPDTIFVIDESYLPFVVGGEKESMISRNKKNMIVLNSMSKIFRVPGLRIGFLISSNEVAERFKKYAMPWCVNSIASLTVEYIMENPSLIDDFINKTKLFLEEEKRVFCGALVAESGIKPFPGAASFILAKLPEHLTSSRACQHLADSKILIRECSNFYGLSDRFIRVSLKTKEINSQVAKILIELAG